MAATPPGPGKPFPIPALGPAGDYHAKVRIPVADVAGHTVAELSQVPPLFVDRSLRAQRRAEAVPAEERAELFARAARLFAAGAPDGRTPQEYQYLVSRVGGLPLAEVRAATAAVAARLAAVPDSAGRARPVSALDPEDTGRALRAPDRAGLSEGRAVWARRGELFAVHAAGNHPGTHTYWPEALALGYRVAVRPSSRDPFPPHRLISALRAAGLPDAHATLLPTAHAHAETLLRGADLAMVYGGEEVARRYGADAKVLMQGPGRSKILVTADCDWRAYLDVIASSIADHAGTGCVNATAVFVQGDASGLCAALAERFAALPSLPPQDEKAVLPVAPAASARAIAAHLGRAARFARPWLGADTVVDELGDGSAVLRPAVHQVEDPADPALRTELPFPCVWVAPWSPDAGLAPLRETLVLTALTRDAALTARLLAEPSIANLHVGAHPTHLIAPGLPHDGFLGEFLMRSKSARLSTM